MIGAGANRKTTGRMLNQFIDKTGIPFATTQLGKGVVDERHPSFSATRRCRPAISCTGPSRPPMSLSMSAMT